MDKYMLISVCGREILTERFKTKKDAQDAMHREMVEQGRVPEDVFSENEFEDCDYGFGEDSALDNDGFNHEDFDWLIVYIGGEK